MQQASWAAAGMLAAGDPENPAALSELSQFSLACYPGFLRRLEDFSDIHLLTSHTLQICDERHLPLAREVLTAAEAKARVPGLRLGPGQEVLCLEEQSLDPRTLCSALPSAVRAEGVAIYENTPVLSATPQGDLMAVTTPQGTFSADALIVTTGTWAAEAAAPSLHHLPAGSVQPRKGQMLRLQQPAGSILNTVLRSPTVYIVPRGNGTLIVGATVEDVGFDRATHPDATAWLLEQAAELWAPLGNIRPAQIEAVWTGLRPATADQLPILGALDHPQVIFATGHYRNGILLAPGTAKVVASLVTDNKPEVDLRPFHPSRLLHPTNVQSITRQAVAS
jgi:glycine oxidase